MMGLNYITLLITITSIHYINSSLSSAAYVSVNWASIGSDNGLSPILRQAIIYTNTKLFSIRPLETNFSEIVIEIQIFSFTKMCLKISSAK